MSSTEGEWSSRLLVPGSRQLFMRVQVAGKQTADGERAVHHYGQLDGQRRRRRRRADLQRGRATGRRRPKPIAKVGSKVTSHENGTLHFSAQTEVLARDFFIQRLLPNKSASLSAFFRRPYSDFQPNFAPYVQKPILCTVDSFLERGWRMREFRGRRVGTEVRYGNGYSQGPGQSQTNLRAVSDHDGAARSGSWPGRGRLRGAGRTKGWFVRRSWTCVRACARGSPEHV